MENSTSFKRLPGWIREARKFWVNSRTPCSTRVIRRSNTWTGTRFSLRWFPTPAPRELPGAPSPPAVHPTARWISSQVGLGWGREGFRLRFLGHDAHLRNPALSPGVGAMSLPALPATRSPKLPAAREGGQEASPWLSPKSQPRKGHAVDLGTSFPCHLLGDPMGTGQGEEGRWEIPTGGHRVPSLPVKERHSLGCGPETPRAE